MKILLGDQEGVVYNNLLVRLDLGLVEQGTLGKNQRYVLADCLRCGSVTKKYALAKLRNGHTKSCGCLMIDTVRSLKTKHGMVYSKVYKCWQNMKTRCDNPSSSDYHHYGGRGITYEESWKDFSEFWSHMKDTYQEDLELDRIDVNGNYFKENCRWTSRSENTYNTRISEKNTSGRTGVYFHKRDLKWQASIQVEGKQVSLGYFETFEAAVKAREQAELKVYGYNKQ